MRPLPSFACTAVSCQHNTPCFVRMLSKHKMLENLSKKNHNMWCKRGFARETPPPFSKKRRPRSSKNGYRGRLLSQIQNLNIVGQHIGVLQGVPPGLGGGAVLDLKNMVIDTGGEDRDIVQTDLGLGNGNIDADPGIVLIPLQNILSDLPENCKGRFSQIFRLSHPRHSETRLFCTPGRSWQGCLFCGWPAAL